MTKNRHVCAHADSGAQRITMVGIKGMKTGYKGGNVPDREHVKYFVDPGVQRHLKSALYEVNVCDDDRCYIVDGKTGAGKSVAAMQFGYYLDPTFDLDHVCFNLIDFYKAVQRYTKGQSIVFDEAFESLTWRDATTKQGKLMTKLLMQCRQKNLFLFLVLPDAFELASYISRHRANGLFYFYKKTTIKADGTPFIRKGRYIYWGQGRVNELLFKARKSKDYCKAKVRPLGWGSTSNFYVVDEASYRAKKAEAFKTDTVKALKIIEELESGFHKNKEGEKEGWQLNL
jgi:hypothetical protein